VPSPASIRPADVEDAAGIAAVYRPYVTDSVASFETVAPGAAEFARRMTAAPRLPWFVACRDDAVVTPADASCTCPERRRRSSASTTWPKTCRSPAPAARPPDGLG
jgi:L-amino acid N-acyltransferase YncA